MTFIYNMNSYKESPNILLGFTNAIDNSHVDFIVI
jgi:hypothetical protein